MNAALLYPFILVAGALQALGNSMNARLRDALVNPWLAATYSFMPIVIVFTILFFTMPTPLPTLQTLGMMPWYAPLGGVAGAVAVFGGLAFVDKVGAGPFNGLTITANILTSLALDSLGLFGLKAGGFKAMPWLGGLLMVVGIVFIARATGPKSDDEQAESGKGGLMARLLYPFILVAGSLQAVGVVLNAQLRGALVNPWLAATVSFIPVALVFLFVFLLRPTPLPTRADVARVPWWGALGGIAGAVAVFAGLAFVDKVGAGPFNGLTITANILTSLALDSLGLFGLKAGGFKAMPWLGGLLMVVGIVFIARATGPKSDDEQAESGQGGLMAKLLYPFILVAGSLQAVGVVLNAQLRGALVNPWLAATVSFIPVALVFLFVFLLRPTPLPTRADVARVPWWGALGGIAGAVAVFAGLLFVDKVGAGAFNGLLITANLFTSIAIDHFGWLGMKRVRAGIGRLIGGLLMAAGIVLISVF